MYFETEIKTECTGCGACVDSCPKECISLVEDNERFLYPVIDKTNCVNCNLCKKVCPQNKNIFNNISNNRKVIVAKSKQEKTIFESSSGGAFTAIYLALLKQNYCVWGVKWGEGFKVMHDCAITEEECEKFRKSKYVLSDTNHVYKKIEKQLKNGERVCFVGTPCQCAALRTFLEAKKVCIDKLFIIDIICHGAPNQVIFDRYLKEKAERIGEVRKYTFKNKLPIEDVINSRTVELIVSSGKSLVFSVNNDPFLKGYYGRLFYRPSCKECNYACLDRVSDITLGDAWQIEDVIPEWNSLEGISLILFNTEKGKTLLTEIEKTMDIRESSIEWAVRTNSQLREPTQMHRGREKFFVLFDKCTFEDAVEMSMKVSLIRRWAGKIKRILSSMLLKK